MTGRRNAAAPVMICRAKLASKACGALATPASDTARAERKPAPRPQSSSPMRSSPGGACRWPVENLPMKSATQTDATGGQTSTENPCLLEFRNIRIVYDNAIEAIRDVSIAVPEGGIVALLGSNGAGKSTLLKAMSGILYTEEGVLENGTIRFRGEDVHHLAPAELVRRGLRAEREGLRGGC